MSCCSLLESQQQRQCAQVPLQGNSLPKPLAFISPERPQCARSRVVDKHVPVMCTKRVAVIHTDMCGCCAALNVLQATSSTHKSQTKGSSRSSSRSRRRSSQISSHQLLVRALQAEEARFGKASPGRCIMVMHSVKLVRGGAGMSCQTEPMTPEKLGRSTAV